MLQDEFDTLLLFLTIQFRQYGFQKIIFLIFKILSLPDTQLFVDIVTNFVINYFSFGKAFLENMSIYSNTSIVNDDTLITSNVDTLQEVSLDQLLVKSLQFSLSNSCKKSAQLQNTAERSLGFYYKEQCNHNTNPTYTK